MVKVIASHRVGFFSKRAAAASYNPSLAFVPLDGLISYSMPQGERRNNDIGLLDFTYDGNITLDNQLYGGLGQLTDGDEGQSNFRLDPSSRGVRGYEWVGWRNESFTVDKPLEILCL